MMPFASSKSISTVFLLSVVTLIASLVLNHLKSQRQSPLDFDVEELLLSGRARERWVEWSSFDWAARAVKRKLKPRLPRRDQEMRDLVWGDLQFLHTTDIHGFYLPHHSPVPPATSYSADWADWVSFIDQMKDKARSEGRDLVVVDSGDLVTGHGLSDARNDAPPGLFSNQIFALADYDILTVGNHELYSLAGVEALRKHFIPRWKQNYLTSNVNFTTSNNRTSLSTSPLGSLYTSFILPQTGLRLTSLGILFDFTSPLREISIQTPTEILAMPWFNELMQSKIGQETDVWLLAGHMPLDGPEDVWEDLIKGMRKWDSVGQKPIVGLGGHTHLRNCREDSNTIVLQSGRFHETAGFVSIAFPQRKSGGNSSSRPLGRLTFSRRYIDLNPLNLAHHLSLSLHNSSLTTPFAHYVRHILHTLAAKWKLDEVHGFAPKDWFLDRYSAEDERSILQGTKGVLSRIFWKSGSTEGRAEEGRVVMVNSGSLRGDLRKGPFTKSDQFVVSPFSDSFYSIHFVPFNLAVRLVSHLNGDKAVNPLIATEDVGQGEMRPSSVRSADSLKLREERPSEGYVTVDRCGVDGRDGDDTIHSHIPLVPFEPPFIIAVASPPALLHATSEERRTVEIVTVQYLLPRLLSLLDHFASDSERSWNVSLYEQGHIRTRDIWMIEAREIWGQNQWEEQWERYGREAEQRGFEVYDI